MKITKLLALGGAVHDGIAALRWLATPPANLNYTSAEQSGRTCRSSH